MLTVHALGDADTRVGDLRRPGHVFPLRARDGGVLARPGHTEAAVDLLRIARRDPVAVITELANDDGTMMSGPALEDFAAECDLETVRVADIVEHRWRTEQLVDGVATSVMPTVYGNFTATVFRSTVDGAEHLALTMGDVVTAGSSPGGVLARVHSECLTGDVIGSLRCDCGSQLEQAFKEIAREGCGVVIYLRGHEGRGIGLGHKIRAYALQEHGLDTVDANTAQGLPVDGRSYGVGAQILSRLGANRLRLITNNPAKYLGIRSYGLAIVERVKLPTVPTAENVRYLETKRVRMGHDLGAEVSEAGL